MKKKITSLILVLTIILSSFSISFADTLYSTDLYITAPTTGVFYFNRNNDTLNIYTSKGVKVGGNVTSGTGDMILKDFTYTTYYKSFWGQVENQKYWTTAAVTLTQSDFPLYIHVTPNGTANTFTPYSESTTLPVYDSTGININDPTPVSNYQNGITIMSPSKMANILDDYINIRFVCKVPIESGGSDTALKAEILGQRIDCYATTNRTGSSKYYLPRHDGLKPHFIESNIIDKNSLYYIVTGVISVPNNELGVTTTLTIKLPSKVESVAGITNPTWVNYTASLRTLYNSTLPADVGGSTTDSGDPNQPIGDMPDSADYDRTTITGNLDYWGDTILWFISLPFQALAKAASALTDRVSQAMQWIGTQDSGVIGFFNILFSFLPSEVTGLITVLIILFIVICIYRFMRG